MAEANIIPIAKWESLTEMLDFLTKDSDDSVIIDKSYILHTLKNGAILKADLTSIFDNKEINLHISSPKKWVRLFKTLKDQHVGIIEDTNQFIVGTKQTKLYLPKQLSSVVSQLTFPDLSKINVLVNFVIQKETRNTILNLSKGLNYIELLIQNDNVKVINIPNTGKFILPEFKDEENIENLDTNNADLILRSSVFLPYEAETYKITIGKNNTDEKYSMHTSCQSSLIKIEIYDPLEDATGIENLF